MFIRQNSDFFPKHIGRQLLSVRVGHLGGRRNRMMMMNKRLIVVTWQSSRSPWPETIPPPPIPIVQTPYSQRIHFTSSWLSFNIPIVQTPYSQRILCTSSWSSFKLQSYHCRTLFVAKNCLFTWLINNLPRLIGWQNIGLSKMNQIYIKLRQLASWHHISWIIRIFSTGMSKQK